MPKDTVKNIRIAVVVDRVFKDRVKMKCIRTKITMQELMQVLLTNWLKDS